MNAMKNKRLLLTILVIFLGLGIAGGTYAILSVLLSTTNGSYAKKIECFDINYSITNDDNTTTQLGGNFDGTLFPTSSASSGISGRVSMSVASSCSVTGTATLYLNVSTATSTALLTTTSAHCEDSTTLETKTYYASTSTSKYETLLYDNSSDCTTAGGTWVTTGSAIKYAVYTNSSATGSPVAKGYITDSYRGASTPIYTGFTVNNTALNLYVFVWMDGYLTDNTYTSLPFDGYIHATITQTE